MRSAAVPIQHVCPRSSFDRSRYSMSPSNPFGPFPTFVLISHPPSPQRLAYSPDAPVGDAAKLYWHFRRTGQSGFAGVVITLFLYAVLFLLSGTVLFIYLLR